MATILLSRTLVPSWGFVFLLIYCMIWRSSKRSNDYSMLMGFQRSSLTNIVRIVMKGNLQIQGKPIPWNSSCRVWSMSIVLGPWRKVIQHLIGTLKTARTYRHVLPQPYTNRLVREGGSQELEWFDHQHLQNQYTLTIWNYKMDRVFSIYSCFHYWRLNQTMTYW